MSDTGHYHYCERVFRKGIAPSKNKNLEVVRCMKYIPVEVDGEIQITQCGRIPSRQSCGKESTWRCPTHYGIYCSINDMSPFFSYCANRKAKNLGFTVAWMEEGHPHDVLEALGLPLDKKYLHVQEKYVKEYEEETNESDQSEDESFSESSGDESDDVESIVTSSDDESDDNDNDDFLYEEVFPKRESIQESELESDLEPSEQPLKRRRLEVIIISDDEDIRDINNNDLSIELERDFIRTPTIRK